jgi:hypothetical protein
MGNKRTIYRNKGFIHKNRALYPLGWLLLWTLLSGFSTPLSDQTIIRNFDLIAFGNEYTNERFSRVRKWAIPLRMGIQGDYSRHFENNVQQYSQDLQKITGHPISLYYSHNLQKKGNLDKNFNKNKVNVILFYLPVKKIPKAILKYFNNDRVEVDRMIRQSTCFAKYFRRKNEIRAAVVVFPSHLPPRTVRACVVEELAQILGLPNDSDLVKNSIFKDKGIYNELTEQDKILLKILYDPRIKFNMKREVALEKALIILKEIRQSSHAD